jgi:predicted nucleic-acid-binding Zn-ribbon protein
MPTCPKCGHRSFAISEISPVGAQYKMYAVNCANIACQAAVGVTEYYSAGALLKKQKAAIDELGQRLSRIETTINQIAHVLNNRLP